MFKEVLRIVFATKTLLGILFKKLTDEIDALGRDVDTVFLHVQVDYLLFDLLEHHCIPPVAGIEWREPYNHLIGENTNAPPIN